MMRSKLCACCLAAAAAAIVPAASADERGANPPPPAPVKAPDFDAERDTPPFVFQIGLYRLKRPAEGGGEGIRHFPERHPVADSFAHGAEPHAFGALACEQCHSTVSWPTEAAAGPKRTFADRSVGEALTDAVAEVIAEPVLSTVGGRPAHLRLQGGEVEYFEVDGEGGYRVRKIKDESGVEVRLCVGEATEENDTLNVTVEPFEIRITTLDHREPVEGVALAVGKPVFRTFEWDATLTCRPGQINAFTLDSPRQGRILVVVRLEVSRAATEGEEVGTEGTEGNGG